MRVRLLRWPLHAAAAASSSVAAPIGCSRRVSTRTVEIIETLCMAAFLVSGSVDWLLKAPRLETMAQLQVIDSVLPTCQTLRACALCSPLRTACTASHFVAAPVKRKQPQPPLTSITKRAGLGRQAFPGSGGRGAGGAAGGAARDSGGRRARQGHQRSGGGAQRHPHRHCLSGPHC